MYAGDLPFCMFVQTFAFVAFNKVSTAQYFVWYFALLPVALPALSDTTHALAKVFAVWGLRQLHWLVSTTRVVPNAETSQWFADNRLTNRFDSYLDQRKTKAVMPSILMSRE